MMEALSPSQINARVKVLARPFPSPGKCAMCGAVDRTVVDLGFDIRGYGTVMFCTVCVTEIGEAVDLVPSSKVIDTERAVGDLVKDYLEARNLTAVSSEFIGSLDNTLAQHSNDLRRSIHVFHVQDANVFSVPDNEIPGLQFAEGSGSVQDSKVGKRQSGKSSSNDDKSSGVEGPTGVSDAGSNSNLDLS